MTTFADPRLELAVRAAMPQDVLAQPLSTLTRLDATGLGIRRLRGIEQLSELRWLDLGHNPISSVAELGATTKLIRLMLRQTDISTLAGLEGLPELEDLDLYASRVITIEAIAGLPSLRCLDLGQCRVADLAPLAHATRLETLTLGNPTLHVARRSVFFSSDAVSLALGGLAQLTNLRQLRLYGLRLPSLSILAELVGLEELVLERCELGDGLAALPRLPRLELLDLSHCVGLELGSLAALPRLRTLNLDEAKLADLSPLVGCESLELISMRETEIGDARSVQKLRALPRLAQLRVGDRLVE